MKKVSTALFCRRSRWGFAHVYGWQLVVENDVEK
jgi:hypothetical protein